jgi:hypothetical protein
VSSLRCSLLLATLKSSVLSRRNSNLDCSDNDRMAEESDARVTWVTSFARVMGATTEGVRPEEGGGVVSSLEEMWTLLGCYFPVGWFSVAVSIVAS